MFVILTKINNRLSHISENNKNVFETYVKREDIEQKKLVQKFDSIRSNSFNFQHVRFCVRYPSKDFEWPTNIFNL